ncbi:hypothetical protein BKA61DRAFT_714994 [Leptodontidium sp. MPI-SDFR-AT-0119]|nr:hypothetical protein BKA61DRAFT_714994 [Leptodontidium sp. MPI-SDFR-AT-0119]
MVISVRPIREVLSGAGGNEALGMADRHTFATPATFVAAFLNEDPGVGQIAQEYFGLENEIVKGNAGGELSIDGADIDKFRAAIPANVAAGVDSCLAKCGISKR